jgi:hypothetical protein
MSGLRQFWQRWQSLILIIGAAVWTVITAGASAYWSVRQFQATSEQFQSRLAFERETRDNARASAEHDRFWQMRWGDSAGAHAAHRVCLRRGSACPSPLI